MILVLLGALLAAPLLAALIARMIQPLARRCFSDHLASGRGQPGAVAGPDRAWSLPPCAAGVALVTQTYGTIVSNQIALREWVQESIAADLIVSLRQPHRRRRRQSEVMTGIRWATKMAKIKGVEAVLPMRISQDPLPRHRGSCSSPWMPADPTRSKRNARPSRQPGALQDSQREPQHRRSFRTTSAPCTAWARGTLSPLTRRRQGRGEVPGDRHDAGLFLESRHHLHQSRPLQGSLER